jgi:hypothetical protein
MLLQYYTLVLLLYVLLPPAATAALTWSVPGRCREVVHRVVVLEYSIVIAFDAPLRTQGSNLGPGMEDKRRGQKDSIAQQAKIPQEVQFWECVPEG